MVTGQEVQGAVGHVAGARREGRCVPNKELIPRLLGQICRKEIRRERGVAKESDKGFFENASKFENEE